MGGAVVVKQCALAAVPQKCQRRLVLSTLVDQEIQNVFRRVFEECLYTCQAMNVSSYRNLCRQGPSQTSYLAT